MENGPEIKVYSFKIQHKAYPGQNLNQLNQIWIIPFIKSNSFLQHHVPLKCTYYRGLLKNKV